MGVPLPPPSISHVLSLSLPSSGDPSPAFYKSRPLSLPLSMGVPLPPPCISHVLSLSLPSSGDPLPRLLQVTPSLSLL